jgi:hypothetical protein
MAVLPFSMSTPSPCFRRAAPASIAVCFLKGNQTKGRKLTGRLSLL